MPILLQRALLAFPVCAMLSAASTIAAQTPGSETLWYVKPAAIWDEALPIGNGRLGAMVFGGANTTANNGDQQNKRVNDGITHGSKTRPQDEHLQLNESTVWQGSRADKLNLQGHEGFLEARKLLLESDIGHAKHTCLQLSSFTSGSSGPARSLLRSLWIGPKTTR